MPACGAEIQNGVIMMWLRWVWSPWDSGLYCRMMSRGLISRQCKACGCSPAPVGDAGRSICIPSAPV
eukprot:scaffold238459_cov13-Tisochrysis_lutea.AAC.1